MALTIKKETWLGVKSNEERDSLFYDIVDELDDNIKNHQTACELKFKEVEGEHTKLAKFVDRRKKVDRGLAIFSGGVGGFLGVLFSGLKKVLTE